VVRIVVANEIRYAHPDGIGSIMIPTQNPLSYAGMRRAHASSLRRSFLSLMRERKLSRPETHVERTELSDLLRGCAEGVVSIAAMYGMELSLTPAEFDEVYNAFRYATLLKNRRDNPRLAESPSMSLALPAMPDFPRDTTTFNGRLYRV